MGDVSAASSRVTLKRQTRLVMVVDDDQNHLLYHAMLLQRFEYRVCTARNVTDAMAMTERTVPSLIVTELDLPSMGAFDLLGRVRQNERTSAVPIIALIEDGDQDAEDRCLRAGFTACLRKPVGAEELYRSVQTAVEPVPRGNLRIQAKLPVSVNNVPLDCVEGECASVISEHGMYIRTLRPHPPKARLSIKIALNGRTIAADAVVLYSHRFGEGPFGEPGMGIKFARIAPHDQEHLRSYIHSQVSGGVPLRV
jgi:two-component system cell cycle response regulator DivK